MAEVTKPEPQSANDYDDRTTAAVKATLIEIGQILGSYQGKFAIIGGSVPWLLLDNKDMPHVGTVDIDLGLDHEALADGEYAGLVENLMKNGYEQRTDLKMFQLVRSVPATDGGDAINVIVDFLMPRDAEIAKNDPVLIENFAVQKASGADLALKFNEIVAISGKMPDGGTNKVEIVVASIPALLAMKGFAVKLRKKHKDAYDIYYCVRNYPGGIEALAKASIPLLEHASGKNGFDYIAEKFNEPDGFGPTCVRLFVEETKLLGERTADQWQQDAFGQVNALLQIMGLVELKSK